MMNLASRRMNKEKNFLAFLQGYNFLNNAAATEKNKYFEILCHAAEKKEIRRKLLHKKIKVLFKKGEYKIS
jgi:hypothetical protein